MKDGKHIEAMLNYTHAIKIQPNNHEFYSNRSLAFLKLEQHYHAREDSLKVIQLNPTWPKVSRYCIGNRRSLFIKSSGEISQLR